MAAVRVTARSAVVWAAVVVVLALIAWGVLGKTTAQAPARPVAGSSHKTVSPAPSDSASQGTATPSGSPSQGTAGHGWKLKFSAQFTGSHLNTNTWGTCYPGHDVPSGCTHAGYTEHEWYLPAQDRVANGALELVAQRLPTQGRNSQGTPVAYGCRSGMVTTYPSFRFKYGYVQIVARIPYSYGLWPALWLAAANLRWPPEIDIMEHWGDFPNFDQFFHPVGHSQFSGKAFPGNMSVGWHSFSLLWSPSKLVWFIDGRERMIINQYIPNIRMYLIADLAESDPVQANHGCDGTMLIRSVKIWQR